MVAYVMEQPEMARNSMLYEYKKRIIGSGTMVDEPVIYKNKIIHRAKVSDEMIALLVLML